MLTARTPAGARPPVWVHVGVGVLAVSTAVIWAWLAVNRHRAFGTMAFDVGIFDQVLWLIASGFLPFSTILERHFFGEHFQPVLYLLAFLKAGGGGPERQLVAQAMWLAASVTPLAWLTWRRTEDSLVTLALTAAFLSQQALFGIALYEFHPYSMSTPLVAAAAAALMAGHVRVAFALLLACGLVREDLWLSLAGAGLVLVADGRKKLGGAWIAGGAAMTVLLVFVVIPTYRGGEPYEFLQRFVPPDRESHGWLAALVRHSDPVRRAAFVGQLLWPMALLPLLGPRWLLGALPTAAVLLLSVHRPQYSIGYHYSAPLLPWIAVAAIAALGRVPRWLALTGLSIAAVSGWIVTEPWTVAARYSPTPERREARLVLARIPARASVCAQGPLVPHLASREVIRLFPHVRDVDFVALAPRLPERGPISEVDYRAMRERLLRGPGWRLAWEQGGVEVYARAPLQP